MFPCLGFPTAPAGSAGICVLGKPPHISAALIRAQRGDAPRNLKLCRDHHCPDSPAELFTAAPPG